MIRTKRIYDRAEPGDGVRVLVDRLWPRGVRKEDARLDAWAKELAPSDGLRRRFHRDRAQFEEFEIRYREELLSRPEVESWRHRASQETITLLTAAKDPARSHVSVLTDVLGETD